MISFLIGPLAAFRKESVQTALKTGGVHTHCTEIPAKKKSPPVAVTSDFPFFFLFFTVNFTREMEILSTPDPESEMTASRARTGDFPRTDDHPLR